MTQPRNQRTRAPASMLARRIDRRAKGDLVTWGVPCFPMSVKSEFVAHAKRHNLTIAGLLEDVLRDYLVSQGIRVPIGAAPSPLLPPEFSQGGKQR